MTHTQSSIPGKISVLIVDDSLVFRRFLCDTFEDDADIIVAGEAENGIEALDLVLKTNPDVIMLDLEMPLMDGMTTLQHLMIHRPTPTIMFSSISEEGTARCFDTLKNGAIDFLCKDFIFQKNNHHTYQKVLLEKVRRASKLKIFPREPLVQSKEKITPTETEPVQRVVFCEDCGHREVVNVDRQSPLRNVVCSQCGDTIELGNTGGDQYRRNSFISVIGRGEGSFCNLLEIIPQLKPDMGGALLIVLHQKAEYLKSFTEYLDAVSAMKVIRGQEGMNVEGGNCYIFAAGDFMCLKPFSAQLTLHKVRKTSLNGGPFDIMLASVSTIFKKRCAGIVLSGDDQDGEKGLSFMLKNGGIPVFLNPEECYGKNMSEQIRSYCKLMNPACNIRELVEKINKLHTGAKQNDSFC